MILKGRPVVCYDIEVYYKDWIVVFGDTESGNIEVFTSRDPNVEGMQRYIDTTFLAGWNNFRYDDRMLTRIVCEPYARGIKIFNDALFREMKRAEDGVGDPWINGLKFPVMKTIHSLDLQQELPKVTGYPPSLKFVMANMGYNIHESPVDFNIDRALTDEELELAIKYCINDVKKTMIVCENREDEYIRPKEFVTDMVCEATGKSYRDLSRKKVTKLVDMIFGSPHKTDKQVIIDDLYDRGLMDDELREYWSGSMADSDGNHTKIACENVIDFGWGGIHGVMIGQTSWINERIFHIDVNSMYPSIAILLELLGLEKTKLYKMLYDRRLEAKFSGDKFTAEGLKLALNKLYGILGNKYFDIFDLEGLNTICIYGQTALYNLGLQIENLGQILQFNTDGIYFKPNDDVTEEMMRECIKEWEDAFGLTMDIEYFTTLSQSNVNNYIAVEDNGDIHYVGELGKAQKAEGRAFGLNYKEYNNTIIPLAVVNYIVHGIPLEETICDTSNDLIRYMTITKLTKAYPYIKDLSTGEVIDNNTNRIFMVVRGGGNYRKVKHTKYDEIKKRYDKARDKLKDHLSKVPEMERDKMRMTKKEFKDKWKTGLKSKIENAEKSIKRYRVMLDEIEEVGYIETESRISGVADYGALIVNGEVLGSVDDHPELKYTLDYQYYIKKAEEVLARYV